MYGAIAVFITAFAFWVWTWGKGIPYINQEPGQKWRVKAKAAARNRSKVLDQSSVAWKSGEKGTAKTLSERGKQYGRQVERYNERAAKEIFLSLNPTYYHNPPTAETLGKIDLHGLFVTEALIFTQGHIQQCKQYGVTTTSIITGRGNNSKDGVAKIKPAVESLLVREGLTGKFRWENEGCVAVEIPLVAREPIVSRDNCVVM